MALSGSMRARRAAGRSINATMMAPPATGRKSGTVSMGDADTFLLATALGLAGLPAAGRTRTSLILAASEAGMPVAGVLGGPGPGDSPAASRGYTAAAVTGLAALLALRPGRNEAARPGRRGGTVALKRLARPAPPPRHRRRNEA